MSARRYRRSIARGLEAALTRAISQRWNAHTERVVIFSDLHRGQRDHADDFRRCAATYRHALDHYFSAGFRLVTLGDAEELWEGWPGKVIGAHHETFEDERRFHEADGHRLIKIWGNHDDLWQYPTQVVRHLHPVLGKIEVAEGLDVTVADGSRTVGRIFLVHGHQGTGSSDRWGGVSRHFVRWVWRPVQRLFKISLNTPATDFGIRGKHDRAMYEWAAARNDLVLIAGHTHNPVVVSKPHHGVLSEPDDQNGVSPAGYGGGVRTRGCYFNAGCCCFSNGDITGIEIADGEIRLVRWTRGTTDPDTRILERRSLASVFSELDSPR